MGEENPKSKKPPWRGIVFLVAGVVLVLSAALLAQRTGLGTSLVLDLKGLRTIGSAEPMGDGVYYLRYQHPRGAIYRRRYTGRLSGEPMPNGELEVAVVFHPEKPNRFQPAGLSYLPGVVALTMFIAGMWCVLRARSVMRDHYSKAGGKPKAKVTKPRGSLKPVPTRARLKILRIILSIVIALFLLLLFYGCPQLNIPSMWDGNVVVGR
ncbi:MAG: hypothetical protein R6V12_01465 [Candidatus Hydrogenedentota bacterium]